MYKLKTPHVYLLIDCKMIMFSENTSNLSLNILHIFIQLVKHFTKSKIIFNK